ncbi:hypothetical protein P3X46_013211 [Hevea brasiliensis]|uniref:F-box domain-containing protein n=1 Tax=Hevea brasiliensis TaxID=3981 RepID=A0ABQ9M6P2_HEVBR|nr:hypothetical protein P3X46_013211 [Hevea brasiliensis]
MDNNNRDMFLTLETSLLVLIVSYLPFKEAVRTSILSKQWRNVWCETTNLEFHEKFFVNLEKTDKNQRIQRSSFFDFVRKFLACYPGYSKFCNVLLKTKWFPYRCAKLWSWNFSDPTWREEDDPEKHPAVVELPFQVYQHVGLESLKLFSCNFDVSRFKNFTVLKGVSLGWIEINLASIKTLLLSCPLLKSLGLKKCWNIDHLEICLPNWRLKNLYIDKCNFIQDFFWIEGPNLQFLKYSGKVGRFHMYNQREIVEANLNFGMEPEFGEIGLLLYDFLQEFLAVKVLTVCSVLLQLIIFEHCTHHLNWKLELCHSFWNSKFFAVVLMVPLGEEPFNLQASLNVRHLILKTAMHAYEFYGIRFMFRSCPKLEILTFDIGPAKIFPDYEPPFELNPHEFWSRNAKIDHCIHRSLKVVNVKGFKGTMNELYVLRYIINCGRKLRKLNLFIANKEDDNGQNRKSYMAKARLVKKFQSSSRKLQLLVF